MFLSCLFYVLYNSSSVFMFEYIHICIYVCMYTYTCMCRISWPHPLSHMYRGQLYFFEAAR